MSDTPSLELRTQAVRLWGTSTATFAQSAQDCVKSLRGNLSAYTDLPSVSADVRYADERLKAALTALYDVEAAAHRIAEARLAEEQERS